MKKVLLVLASVAIVGCTSKTEHGECIGLFDDKKPELNYKLNGWNTLMAVVGTSLLFVPTIFVIKDETFCPVSKK